jgi:hypothetical protein
LLFCSEIKITKLCIDLSLYDLNHAKSYVLLYAYTCVYRKYKKGRL